MGGTGERKNERKKTTLHADAATGVEVGGGGPGGGGGVPRHMAQAVAAAQYLQLPHTAGSGYVHRHNNSCVQPVHNRCVVDLSSRLLHLAGVE